jgi:hypothetical protein
MYTVIQAFECAASARKPRLQRAVTPSSKQLITPSVVEPRCEKDFSSSKKSEMQNVAFPGDNTLHSEVSAMAPISPTSVSYYSPLFLLSQRSLISTDSNFAFCAQQGKAVI